MRVHNITGVDRLIRKLKRKAREKGRERESVITGYTANYALYVHENREIWYPGMRLAGLPRPGGKGFYWDPQGIAKPGFLLDPARALKPEIRRIVYRAVSKGLTLGDALLLAGLRIQRESQLQAPVDTGNLKASAFTEKE